MNQVVKRDGRVVPFDANKIMVAIQSAMERTELGVDSALATYIAQQIASEPNDLTVEEIQNRVEDLLMSSNRKDVAKTYILYRAERSRIRAANLQLIKDVVAKTNGSHVENSNANVDEYSFGGRKNEAASVIQKTIALQVNIPPDVAAAHKEGYIYEHDNDSTNLGMHNCLFLDLQHIFSTGFTTRNGDVRPPSSFSTACQLVAVAMQVQSQCQFGGVASAHIDSDLAPYVAMSFKKHLKDGLKYVADWDDEMIASVEDTMALKFESTWTNTTAKGDAARAWKYAVDMMEREGKQAAEGLFHNLNTLESRAGSQVPFSSLNLGRDTSPEGRLVTRWLLEASLNGIGKYHVTSIFPITIFNLKKGVNMNPEDPNYDLKQLALKSMSKRIYPNFSFGDFSEAHEDPNDPDTIFTTMGCRTMIGKDIHGYGYRRVGRGNNCPITIILPKLGIEHGICLNTRQEADLEGFWQHLDEILKLTEKGLLARYEIMKRQSPKAATFMYGNGTIVDADKCIDTVEPALKHNTLAIGYIGIAEMCQALFGKNHANDARVHAFAMKVVARINAFAKEATARNQLNFSCYATPAESLCSTALQNLRRQYGVIENVTSHDWLTNSHHVPVWEKVSIFDKLRIEAPFCKFATGGCITYIECESTFMENLEAVEDIIDYACNLDIPYLAFNFPIDTCLDCGYQGEFNTVCPECGSDNICSLRRVTGYLSVDYRRFNQGKRAEVDARVKHSAYTSFGGDGE